MAIRTKPKPTGPEKALKALKDRDEKIERLEHDLESVRTCPNCGHVLRPLTSTERVRKHRARKKAK